MGGLGQKADCLPGTVTGQDGRLGGDEEHSDREENTERDCGGMEGRKEDSEESEMDLPFVDTLLKWLQGSGLGQVKDENKQLHPSLPERRQRALHINRKLGLTTCMMAISAPGLLCF